MEPKKSIAEDGNQHTKPSVDIANQRLSEIVVLLKSINEQLTSVVQVIREINRRS